MLMYVTLGIGGDIHSFGHLKHDLYDLQINACVDPYLLEV